MMPVDEAKHKIREALRIAPRITIGMLQAHLTSRIKHNVRDVVIAQMVGSGEVRITEMTVQSLRGQQSLVRVIEAVPDDQSETD